MLVHLRRCGVVAHHAAAMPAPQDGRTGHLVVFLESNLAQFDLARSCALRIPEVIRVSFSGYSKAIMFLTTKAPHPQG